LLFFFSRRKGENECTRVLVAPEIVKKKSPKNKKRRGKKITTIKR